jgi:hypothetical protein
MAEGGDRKSNEVIEASEIRRYKKRHYRNLFCVV